MDILNQLVAFLGTINPTWAAIAALVLFLFKDKLPKLPSLPFGPSPSPTPGPAPVPKSTPLLDLLNALLNKRFKDLTDAGVEDHDAVIKLVTAIKQ